MKKKVLRVIIILKRAKMQPIPWGPKAGILTKMRTEMSQISLMMD